jgi:hypothetical protein
MSGIQVNTQKTPSEFYELNKRGSAAGDKDVNYQTHTYVM